MLLFINNDNKPMKESSTVFFCVKLLDKLLGDNVIYHSKPDGLSYNIKDLSKIKGVIISGSDLRIMEKQYTRFILNNILPIVQTNIPILGICFGMQMLSLLFKCKLNSFKKRREGRRIVKFSKDSLFKGVKPDKKYYVEHYDYVENLSSIMKIIATDSKGLCYGVKHKELPVYGLQFHPERSGEHGKKIITNFLKMCSLKILD